MEEYSGEHILVEDYSGEHILVEDYSGVHLYWWKSILAYIYIGGRVFWCTHILVEEYSCVYTYILVEECSGVHIYWWKSMRRVHMSVVTASRGEMMQVTPDAARARPKRTFYLSAAALLHKVGIYWKKTFGTYKG